MATLKQCDRCKKVVEAYQARDFITLNIDEGDIKKELCEDCNVDFQNKFLNNLETSPRKV